MSDGSAFITLLKSNFRAWVGAKGFWLVAAGALLPMLLTGAWVAAHQADIEVGDIRMEPASPVAGEAVTFRATLTNVGKGSVGPFNTTFTVHDAIGGDSINLQPRLGGVALAAVPRLAPGATHEINLTWNATAGAFGVLAMADSELIFGRVEAVIADDVAEKDEFNNVKALGFTVRGVAPEARPAPPAGLSGTANATTNTTLRVVSLTRDATILAGSNATFGAVVRNDGAEPVNATVHVRVGTVNQGPFGATLTTATDIPTTLTLAPGEEKPATIVWTTRAGGFLHDAWILPPAGSGDTDGADSYRAEAFTVDPVQPTIVFEPEPQGTIKIFYITVLRDLHLSLLIPLIALFYAAGVIADEKDRGSLAYTLTRPVPRWTIPITKFLASFLVAAVALLVGVALTYVFLFGTTVEARDIGFLTTPLMMTLVTLFAYGAVFILLGTLVERPYLVGLALVLGWEFAAFQFVEWTHNLTLTYHVRNALESWSLADGFQIAPEEPRALLVILAVGVGALVLAAAQMRRREFQV